LGIRATGQPGSVEPTWAASVLARRFAEDVAGLAGASPESAPLTGANIRIDPRRVDDDFSSVVGAGLAEQRALELKRSPRYSGHTRRLRVHLPYQRPPLKRVSWGSLSSRTAGCARSEYESLGIALARPDGGRLEPTQADSPRIRRRSYDRLVIRPRPKRRLHFRRRPRGVFDLRTVEALCGSRRAAAPGGEPCDRPCSLAAGAASLRTLD